MSERLKSIETLHGDDAQSSIQELVKKVAGQLKINEQDAALLVDEKYLKPLREIKEKWKAKYPEVTYFTSATGDEVKTIGAIHCEHDLSEQVFTFVRKLSEKTQVYFYLFRDAVDKPGPYDKRFVVYPCRLPFDDSVLGSSNIDFPFTSGIFLLPHSWTPSEPVVNDIEYRMAGNYTHDDNKTYVEAIDPFRPPNGAKEPVICSHYDLDDPRLLDMCVEFLNSVRDDVLNGNFKVDNYEQNNSNR